MKLTISPLSLEFNLPRKSSLIFASFSFKPLRNLYIFPTGRLVTLKESNSFNISKYGDPAYFLKTSLLNLYGLAFVNTFPKSFPSVNPATDSLDTSKFKTLFLSPPFFSFFSFAKFGVYPRAEFIG